jgi:hypothetical protein
MEWGVVVATDQGTEWLLPWWWENYSRHHRQAVAFVDFGMSEEAREWCTERGILVPFAGEKAFVMPRDGVGRGKQMQWEKVYGESVWQARGAWFKKPLAMLQSPFEKSVWMDLDCEVCQKIDGIFEGIGKGVLGAVKVEKGGHYNSGVVVFDNSSLLLQAWAESCLKNHGSVIGDETLLSKIVRSGECPFKEVGREYNWMMGWGYDPQLKVAHWAASWGKLCIETMGGIQKFLANSVK